MALYREMAGKAEDSDSPEKIVRRVQEVSAVLYHLEQVRGAGGGSCGGLEGPWAAGGVDYALLPLAGWGPRGSWGVLVGARVL